MKHLSTLVFAILCPVIALSTSFQPGHVVLKNKVMVQGYIGFQDDETHPTAILFKSKPDGETITYRPGDLIAFETKSGRYTSVSSPKRGTEKPDLETAAFFFKVIVEGETSLYQYVDEQGNDHFFVKENGVYERLINKTDQSGIGFRSQLSDYLSGCSSLEEDIQRSSYTLKDFEGLFTEWYSCTAEPVDLPNKNMIRYQVPLGKASLFTDVGINNGFLIRPINNGPQGLTGRGPLWEETYVGEFGRLNLDQSFITGMGIQLGGLSLESRFQPASALSNNSALVFQSRRLGMLTRLRF